MAASFAQEMPLSCTVMLMTRRRRQSADVVVVVVSVANDTFDGD